MFLQSEFLSHQRTSFGVSSSDFYSIIITLFLPTAEESSGCSFSWSYQEWLKYQKFDIGQGQKLCWSHLASNSHKEVKRSRGQGVNDIFSLFQGKHLSWSTVFELRTFIQRGQGVDSFFTFNTNTITSSVTTQLSDMKLMNISMVGDLSKKWERVKSYQYPPGWDQE